MDFRGQNGAVYYQAYSRSTHSLFEANTNVRQAKLYIQDIMTRQHKFDISFLLIVTWYQARQFPYDQEWYEELEEISFYWDDWFWDDWHWDRETLLENVQRVSKIT